MYTDKNDKSQDQISKVTSMSHQLNRLKELHGGTDWTNKRKEL